MHLGSGKATIPPAAWKLHGGLPCAHGGAFQESSRTARGLRPSNRRACPRSCGSVIEATWFPHNWEPILETDIGNGSVGAGRLEYDAGMARTEQERERLKEWALNWHPQPTHDRLNRYRKVKFGRWSEYHKSRLVLRLTPEEKRKALSIYHYLLEKHKGKVRSRLGCYRMLWACAVSRCRKSSPQRYERLGIANKLTYWFDRAHEEGCERLGIQSLEKRRSELTGFSSEKRRSPLTESSSAKSLEIGKLLTDLERSFR